VSPFADAGLVGSLLTGRWTMRVHAVPATVTVLIHKDLAAEIEELYR
jgi:hypothetical protein